MLYKNPYIEQCIEGSLSLLKGLSKKDKETLVQHHTYALYGKGEYLLKEGEKPHGLICLASGKVKVFKEGVGGREQILRMVRPQGFIGYRAIFAGSSYSASAMAIEDSYRRILFQKLHLRNSGRDSLTLTPFLIIMLWMPFFTSISRCKNLQAKSLSQDLTR